MNKTILLAGIALLATACSSDENMSEQSVEKFAPVSVRVSDFSMSVEDFTGDVTRAASSVADYSLVEAITLAFYDANNNEFCKTTQLRNDITTFTTFGVFSCNLPIGSYTMVAIAYGFHGNDSFTLTSPTAAGFTGDYVREVFTKTQAVEVTSTTALELNVTLNRIVSRLTIATTDGRPANATKIRTTYSNGSKSFSPTTGLATDNNGFSVINNPSSDAGKTVTVSSFLFLSTSEQTMNVKLEVLDAEENVLLTKEITDVPFKCNRVTKLSGALYTPSSSSASFQVSTDWDTDFIKNF